MTTEENPSYNIHKVSGKHQIILISEVTFIIPYITGEHWATDGDNTYSYVHVLDEPVVENDYIYKILNKLLYLLFV